MENLVKATGASIKPQNIINILNTMLNSMNAHIDTLPKFQPLKPLNYLKKWLDSIEVHNPKLAKFVCQLIPTQCPFERDISFLGHILFHIPPMCKLNPVYDELISLRFRAMCYLADVCGEDVTPYC